MRNNLDKLAKDIKKKIYFYTAIIVAVTFTLTTIVVAITFENYEEKEFNLIKENIVKREKNFVKKQVDDAIYLINFQIKHHKTSTASLQNNIKEILENKRFGTTGYYWIYKGDYTLLMDPYRKDSVGKNEQTLTDYKGKQIVKIFVDKAKEVYPNGIFIEYHWKRPDSNKIEKKLAYVRYFKEWNWIIGSSTYFSDITTLIDNQKEEIEDGLLFKEYKKFFLLFTIIFILVVFLSMNIIKNLEKYFNKYSLNMKKIHTLLENKVAKRTSQLNNLNEELEKRIKDEVEKNRQHEIQLLEQAKFVQLGEMIENIAHQWRQPLSMISTLSTSTILKLELDMIKKDEVIDNFEAINDKTQYLSKTIDQFREFIKESNEEEIVDIKDRVNEALNIVSSSLSYHNIDVKIDCAIDNLEIKLIRGELLQVIINILNNSRDILKDKDIDQKWIKIECVKKSNFVLISIEDNGGGISEDILPKIFDPYFTTKHQSQGIGLGLYMSKKIIEQHLKGKLLVENTQNGAKFTIKLNLTPTI